MATDQRGTVMTKEALLRFARMGYLSSLTYFLDPLAGMNAELGKPRPDLRRVVRTAQVGSEWLDSFQRTFLEGPMPVSLVPQAQKIISETGTVRTAYLAIASAHSVDEARAAWAKAAHDYVDSKPGYERAVGIPPGPAQVPVVSWVVSSTA